jgi:hypothetical protein
MDSDQDCETHSGPEDQSGGKLTVEAAVEPRTDDTTAILSDEPLESTGLISKMVDSPKDPTETTSLDDILLSYMVEAAAEASNGAPQSPSGWSRIARQLGWHEKRYTVESILTPKQRADLHLTASQRISLRVRI